MIHCLLFLYIPVRPLIHIVSLNIKEKEKGASLKELTLRLYTNWQLSSLECEGIAAAQPVEIWSPWEQDVSPKALGALGLSNKLLAVLPSQDGFYYNSWGRYCFQSTFTNKSLTSVSSFGPSRNYYSNNTQ